MAWIRERRWSKLYLIMKKFVNQWFLVCFKLKQIMLVVDVDVCLQKSSSVMLGTLQISFHHWRVHEETELEMLFQQGFDASQCFQMLCKWWNNEENSRVFEDVEQKFQIEQKCKMREKSFSVVFVAAARVENDWKSPLYLLFNIA